MGSPAQAAGPFRASPLAVAWSPPWAAGGCLLHCGPSWPVGNRVPHHYLLQGTLLWHSEHLLPSFSFPFLFVCRAVSNFFSPNSSVLPTAVLPLLSVLKYLSPLGLRGPAVPWGAPIGAGCTQCWATPASSQRLP